MATAHANLASIRTQLREPANDTSLLDQIQDGANKILSIKDQADLYGGLLAAKLGMFTALMDRADKQLESLKDPANYQALDAFLELWDSSVKMATNLAESPRGPRTYVTPSTMSVSDIATAIYGNSERSAEILINNEFMDPFAVPAGTKVIWFETAGLLAA